MKNKAQSRMIVSLLLLVLSFGFTAAAIIYAFPGATGTNTILVAQACNNGSNANTPGAFTQSCNTTKLNLNDGVSQTCTASNNRYCGVNMSSYNSSITNCGTITNVKLCYEWWFSGGTSLTPVCTIRADSDGGASYTLVSPSCPGPTANPGLTCLDVTSSENWVCSDFFNASGTRAHANMEVQLSTGRTLNVDAFYFNVTYTSDDVLPTIIINYPANTTYTSLPLTLNTSISDTNLQSCWWSNNSGTTNRTFTCNTNISLGNNVSSGSNTFKVWANDSYGNLNSSSITFNVNFPPTMANATIIPNPAAGSTAMTIYANTTFNGVNDTEANTLYFYCDDSIVPDSINTECTGGNTTSTYPYNLTCVFNSQSGSGNYAKYCRVYDGNSYSSAIQINYTVNVNGLTTSIVSVAGDSAPSYIDTLNDGKTDIIISGESGMSCRWSSSDLAYGSMTNNCPVVGTEANCSVNNVITQSFFTRYVSCKNSLGTEQTATNNLDVSFYLDYTPPTTSDNSVSSIQLPGYTVTISELDNVDSDPKTYYCVDSVNTCTPTTSIDNGGKIVFNTRGVNYLRYYSIDFAGKTQTNQSKTININRIPILTSASDDAVTIAGGMSMTVSSISSDSDTQTLKLYVCSSSGASSSGCTGTQYCSAVGTSNLSCGFASETDTTTHNWYAHLFDDSGEAAIDNPLTGSYTTDSTSPTITLTNPLNNSNITQNSVTFTIVVNEALANAWYSLDAGTNNISLSNTSLYLYTHSNTSIVNGNYNLSIWANDSYGNFASLEGNSFIIDNTSGDTTEPEITIRSPVNNSYSTSASILLNITTDEDLNWAGFTNDSGALTNLGNVSKTSWNATINLTEGEHEIIFYVNDSSTNKNQADKSTTLYVDLTNPSVNSFSCTNPVNDSWEVNCSASVSDSIGLDYAIIRYNATGSWQNSPQISLEGTNSNLNYIISAGNTTPGKFNAEIYLYDLSGRENLTTSYTVNVTDDSFPQINNIIYTPNTSSELDPGVSVNINATIIENYNISSVILMYKNSSASEWTSVNMANNSNLVIGNNSTIVYNASFIPQNETWYFKVNATDYAGNSNVSSEYTLLVANESSFWNSTTIPEIKSLTYAQRSDNNTLGEVYLNNTGDNNLIFNLSISASSPLQGKFDINYTNDDNASYSISSAENISLTLFINTTGINTGLYPYNLTITSNAGTTIYEKQIYIQTAEGPYLQISVDTYSSSVTTSQQGVSYVVSVTNLGTQDASNVILTWALPSIFTLDSGSLTRNFSNLPIGNSGTNTITIDVGSSTSDVSYYINATANASNANSVSTSKTITVSNPVTITQIVTVTSSGGSGGGGLKSAEINTYSKIIEIVRGKQDSFDIEIENKYLNSSLENLTLDLTGFLPQYITIFPIKIDRINSKEIKKFNIQLKIPSYKESYEEHILKAKISGYKVDGTTKQTYIENQNIKLIIQEISRLESNSSLSEAEKAVLEMQNLGFNTLEVNRLLEQAKLKLSENKNKEAMDLSKEIIDTKDKAFSANSLIEKILEALKDPKKTNLLTGNVAKEIVDEKGESISLSSIFTRKVIAGGESSEDVLNMAIAAFNRGDFSTAEERAKSAQILLLLERKGNLGLFLYLYWQFILAGLLIFSIVGILSYKTYQKSSITNKILTINKEEKNLGELILSSQKNYFSGKISATNYHRRISQHQDKLAKIKQERLHLRNKRIKMLSPQQVLQDLGIERIQVENEIKKLQNHFYRDRKISENEYNIEFKLLNERLAEIEGEKITLELLKERKNTKIKPKDITEEVKETMAKSKKEAKTDGKMKKIIEFLKTPFHHFNKRKEKKILGDEAKIKEKIKGMGVI